MTTSNNKQKKIKVRGSGCFDPSDNSFEFTAFNEAPSTQTKVKSCAGTLPLVRSLTIDFSCAAICCSFPGM